RGNRTGLSQRTTGDFGLKVAALAAFSRGHAYGARASRWTWWPRNPGPENKMPRESMAGALGWLELRPSSRVRENPGRKIECPAKAWRELSATELSPFVVGQKSRPENKMPRESMAGALGDRAEPVVVVRQKSRPENKMPRESMAGALGDRAEPVVVVRQKSRPENKMPREPGGSSRGGRSRTWGGVRLRGFAQGGE